MNDSFWQIGRQQAKKKFISKASRISFWFFWQSGHQYQIFVISSMMSKFFWKFSQNFWVDSLSILGSQWFDIGDILSQYTPVIIVIGILDTSYGESKKYIKCAVIINNKEGMYVQHQRNSNRKNIQNLKIKLTFTYDHKESGLKFSIEFLRPDILDMHLYSFFVK